jgi:cytochrome c553
MVGLDFRRVLPLALLALPALAAAQDAVRGQRLYADTAAEKGREVAACAACHADARALRQMIANRGGPVNDAAALARWMDALIAGAQPGARNAKAQYRGVLGATDLRDLAAYIAQARSADAGATARLARR